MGAESNNAIGGSSFLYSSPLPHVEGLALAGDRSKKICAVAPATTQGRQWTFSSWTLSRPVVVAFFLLVYCMGAH